MLQAGSASALDDDGHLRVPEGKAMTSVDTALREGDPRSPSLIGGERAVTSIEVNGHPVALGDPVPVGRQILVAAGLNPAEEYVLVQLERPGIRAIGLDEEVDLHHGGARTFRAWRADRLFLFTVDSIGYAWGSVSITETELRDLATVPGDHVLLLDRAQAPDDVLAAGEAVSLGHAGTERFRTATRLVQVFLDDTIEKFIPRGKHTTEELLTLLDVTPGYLLNVLDHQGHLQPLAPGQVVHVKEGMKFYSQAPGGGAS